MYAVNAPSAVLCLLLAGLMLIPILHFSKGLHFHLFGKPLKSRPKPLTFVDMPPDLQEIGDQVEAQGFQLFGLIEAVSELSPKPAYSWVYGHEEGTIWIETVQISPTDPAMMQYVTLFEDEAAIMTRFPVGATVDTESLHIRFATKDLDAAYQYHLHKVEEWRSIHGPIFKADTLEKTQHYYPIHYKKHRRLDMSYLVPGFVSGIAISLLAAGIMLVDAALLAFFPQYASDGVLVNVLFWTAVVLGGMAFFIPSWVQNSVNKPANALDNRKAKPKREFED